MGGVNGGDHIHGYWHMHDTYYAVFFFQWINVGQKQTPTWLFDGTDEL